MNTGTIITAVLVGIPIILFVLGCLEDFKLGLSVGVFFGAIAIITYCIIGVATLNPTGKFEKIPESQLIIEKSEYRVVIHIKDSRGIVTNSLVVEDLKTYDLIKTGNFEVKKAERVNIFGSTYYRWPEIYPKN